MTVGELLSELENYLSENRTERFLKHVNYKSFSFSGTIDCVYYRCGDVVLQSNETDNGNWSIIIPYVIHCLKYFNKNMNVRLSYVDEDLDYYYFDIVRCYIDEDDDFTLELSSCISTSDW